MLFYQLSSPLNTRQPPIKSKSRQATANRVRIFNKLLAYHPRTTIMCVSAQISHLRPRRSSDRTTKRRLVRSSKVRSLCARCSIKTAFQVLYQIAGILYPNRESQQ
jgi:hypothetical protein